MAKLDRLTQQQLIARILQDWAVSVIQVLKDKLREKQGFVPSDTIQNMKARVIAAAAEGDTSVFSLSFQDSGRHTDMRRIKHRRRPITPEENFILDWVKKKGVEKFKFVPGYTKETRMTISKEKQASRIASAIIISKGRDIQAGRRRRRRGKWYNKEFYRMVEVLVRKILDEQSDYLLQKTVSDMKEAFEIS